MAQFWLPGDSDFALAMREPNLLVGQKPIGRTKFNFDAPYSNFCKGVWLFTNSAVLDGHKHTSKQENTAWLSDFGGALGFNSTSAYVSTPAHSDFVFGTNDFTIYAKLKIDTSNTSHNGVVSHNYGVSTGWALYFFQPLNSLRFRSGDGSIYVLANGAITDTEWHDVLCARSGGVIRLYVDGVEIGSDVTSTQNLSSSSDLFFGKREASDYYLGGGIAEILIFNGIALSQEFITKNKYLYVKPANDSPFLISVPAGGGAPTLSSPGVINVLSDRVTPQVTLTF